MAAGEYGNYSANMGTDVSTKNSNVWDVKNTGKSTAEWMAGEGNEPTKAQKGFGGVVDFMTGKTGKDFIHNRFDVPGIDYSAQAYDPNAAAGQVGNQYTGQFDAMGQQIQNRQGVQAGQSEFRGDQAGFMSELQKRAMGEGPSVAELQQQRGIEQQINAAQAMAAGSSDPALAGRNAANMAGQAMTQGVADAAQLRAGEMQQAGQQYMGALAGARGQDQALALQNAQMQQQQMAQNDQMTQYYMNQGFSRDEAQQKAAMEYEQMKGEQAIETQKINAEIAKANQEAKAKNKGLGLQILGSIFGGMSMGGGGGGGGGG